MSHQFILCLLISLFFHLSAHQINPSLLHYCIGLFFFMNNGLGPDPRMKFNEANESKLDWIEVGRKMFVGGFTVQGPVGNEEITVEIWM